MNRPAEQYGTVVGDGAAPEWCSYDAAVGWLRRAYGLSEGAALNQTDKVIASGNVQRRGRWKHQLRKQFGQDFVPIPPIPAFGDMFFIDIELNFADFYAQTQRQLGKPPAPKRNSRPPLQAELDRALLDFARAGGQKVKQSDKEARAMLTDMGATWPPKTTAFRNLPEQYRYLPGKPPVNGAPK
jgi:hypothetical protein